MIKLVNRDSYNVVIINISIGLFNTDITLKATLDMLKRVIFRLVETIQAIFRTIIPMADLTRVVIGQN